jgi:DNA-binding transcriptional ArsR family regulator
MQAEQFNILLRFFKALADDSRLKIVGILANQECSVEELAALLQLKEPTVSHHLPKLKELNLVTMRLKKRNFIELLCKIIYRIGIVITNSVPCPGNEMHCNEPPCLSVIIW